MTRILYLCDRSYYCANSLMCKQNGGECDHTGQKEHSRTGIRPKDDIWNDDRFEMETDMNVDYYVEKEINDEP